MTDIREHYAMDIPRGTALVDGEHAGHTVLRVRWLEGRQFAYELDDGQTIAVDGHSRVRVDHDAPERQARLAFARSILDLVDGGE